jgi:N-acetylmuramic acid 6-phosphate etherase
VAEKGKTLFDRLVGLSTESLNPRSERLDSLEPLDILTLINDEDTRVPAAVRAVLPAIERAVALVVTALGSGGRLIYVGAGTSGRLGVLDAAECPPTFGTDPSRIVGRIAGGADALTRAVEGAEDREADGRAAIDELGVGPADVVLGIAASWRTPYTVAAVSRARERGARTVYLTTNPPEKVEIPVDVIIAPEVGPEVLMGSTRMKSGTAQKLVLNMITTASMVRLGKTYRNMMVDLMASSDKLRERSKRVLMLATGISYEEATSRLREADGSVKRAVVLTLSHATRAEVDSALLESGGQVRAALVRLGVGNGGAQHA